MVSRDFDVFPFSRYNYTPVHVRFYYSYLHGGKTHMTVLDFLSSKHCNVSHDFDVFPQSRYIWNSNGMNKNPVVHPSHLRFYFAYLLGGKRTEKTCRGGRLVCPTSGTAGDGSEPECNHPSTLSVRTYIDIFDAIY